MEKREKRQSVPQYLNMKEYFAWGEAQSNRRDKPPIISRIR